jgi:type I restriction enzyme S subunit
VSAELQLDKSAWKPVTFGDVVKEVRQSTKDPVADGIERVVGLEHIEPECIHLRNWASIEEETTFTKTFRKGHVLFGRRRAYLKKAARAEFDGICSGDITVMEAKDDLLPELLPFLVCNDKFFDYAVQHSAGGLSPRTKFKDLANYEFLLPPKDQQAKLAELLWAADSTIQQLHELEIRSNKLRSSLLKKHFREEVKQSVKLEEIALVNMGQSPPGTSYNSEGLGAPLLNGPTEFTERYPKKVQWTTQPTKLCENGDIIICVRGNTTGRINIANDEYCIGRGVAAIRGRSDFLTDYVEHALRFNVGEILRVSAGTTFPNIPGASLKAIPVPKHNLAEQTSIVQQLKSADKAISDINYRNERATLVVKSLINQIF